MSPKNIQVFFASICFIRLITILLWYKDNYKSLDTEPQVVVYVQEVPPYEIVDPQEVPIDSLDTVDTGVIPYTPQYIYEPEVPTQEDIELLACVINGESGADYCSDDMRYYVGSVVVNRTKDEAFPDTIQEVVYQPGQYGCIYSKYFTPEQKCIRIASDILYNGSKLPEDVVYQSTQPLGHGIYTKEQNMYFCYK